MAAPRAFKAIDYSKKDKRGQHGRPRNEKGRFMETPKPMLVSQPDLTYKKQIKRKIYNIRPRNQDGTYSKSINYVNPETSTNPHISSTCKVVRYK